MRGVSNKGDPPSTVVPRLGDPVADISLVYRCIWWNPGEG